MSIPVTRAPALAPTQRQPGDELLGAGREAPRDGEKIDRGPDRPGPGSEGIFGPGGDLEAGAGAAGAGNALG
jgi:hypothetical protein